MKVAALALVAACSGVHSDPSGEVALATGLTSPTGIALGPDDVYFVDQISTTGDYQLLHVPKTGGAAQLVATGHVILDVAADAGGVYWLDSAATSCALKAQLAGSDAVTTLGTPSTGIYCSFRKLAIDAGALYFADDQAKLWRIPKSGTGAVAFGTTDTTAGAVAVDSTGVWVSTLHGAKHVSSAGVAAPELVFSHDPPTLLAVDADHLYAMFSGTGLGDGSIVLVPPDSPVTTEASQVTLPVDFAPTGGTIYIATNNADAGIYRASGGDVVQLVASGLPGAIAVDESDVYWTDSARSAVYRMPR